MVCPKCNSNIEQDAAFCCVCGERVETIVQENGGKKRKEYNSTVYILLDLFGFGLLFGTNDFYAGFYKMALFRLLSSVIGFILSGTLGLGFMFFPGLSVLIGFIEIKGVLGEKYILENGREVWLNPLDIIYDREGTNNALLIQYGSCLPAKRRKEFNTGIYIALYFLLGGWALAVNDFYAGYIKTAAVRIILFILGAVLGGTVHIAFEYIFIIISCLIGLLELFLAGEKKYTLENGNLVMVRPLDLIYDRKATEAVLIDKYGCGLANIK